MKTKSWLPLAPVVSVLFLCSLIVVSCDDSTKPKSLFQNTLIIDPNAGPGLFMDPVTVDSAFTTPDSLILYVRYSGGCNEHIFLAIAESDFVPGSPPELRVYLHHDAHGDICRAFVHDRRSFGIRPAIDLYRREHGGEGPFAFLVLAPTGGGQVDTTRVVYVPPEGPSGDEEAGLIALYLSGELRPPSELRDAVETDLAGIRERYGDELTAQPRPLRELEFKMPWTPNVVWLSFDEAYREQVANGEYHHWDSLNDNLGLVSLGLSNVLLSGSVSLRFDAPLHSCVIADLYDDLPGVLWAVPNRSLGDDPTRIYPHRINGKLAYLLRDAWGDCLAGCVYEELWYFKDLGNGLELVGRHDPRTDGPEPPWLGEALLAKDHYRAQRSCPPR